MLSLFAAMIMWSSSSADLRLTHKSPHVATVTFYNDIWDTQAGFNGPMTVVEGGVEVTFEVFVTPNGTTDEGDTVTILKVSAGHYAEPTKILVKEGETAKIEIFELVIG